jgi:PKD repeat protein
MEDSLQSCSSYYCDTVTVSGPNVPCQSIFIAWPDSTQPHNTWVWNLATGTNPMQYTWSWGDNTPDDYTQYPSHTYATSGLYVICLTIVDANLCTSTYCDSVNVQRMSADWVMVPSTINVINPAGINEVRPSQEISIYPNPANEVFYVNGKNLENMDYKVYDVLGNEVLNGMLDNNSVTVSTLSQGVYIFKIIDTKGNVFTKQFIKN